MTPEAINPGHTVPDMLRSDLALEYKVRAALAKGIALAEQHGDYATRDILARAAAGHRGRSRLLARRQLGLIDRIGLQNYLQSQAS